MQTTANHPTNGELRYYLLAHFDRDDLELLLADTEELMRPENRFEKVRLETIANRDSGLATLALKIVDWFEMRGLTRYLLDAIRGTPAGRSFPI